MTYKIKEARLSVVLLTLFLCMIAWLLSIFGLTTLLAPNKGYWLIALMTMSTATAWYFIFRWIIRRYAYIEFSIEQEEDAFTANKLGKVIHLGAEDIESYAIEMYQAKTTLTIRLHNGQKLSVPHVDTDAEDRDNEAFIAAFEQFAQNHALPQRSFYDSELAYRIGYAFLIALGVMVYVTLTSDNSAAPYLLVTNTGVVITYWATLLFRKNRQSPSAYQPPEDYQN